MSKKKKSEAKEKRRSQKKARKLAEKAKYEAWTKDGQNTKSKRVKLRAKRQKTTRMTDHPTGPCGNIGCFRCNPAPYNEYTPRVHSYMIH